MLKRSKCKLSVKVETLMMKDSLEMDKNDVNKIVDACKREISEMIIITHGTDGMINTAEKLSKENFNNKTIILTGAMIPYAFGSSSDGFFNLGCALSFVQTLPKGIYITMHGEYFDWNSVKKNKKKGIFERIK